MPCKLLNEQLIMLFNESNVSHDIIKNIIVITLYGYERSYNEYIMDINKAIVESHITIIL